MEDHEFKASLDLTARTCLKTRAEWLPSRSKTLLSCTLRNETTCKHHCCQGDKEGHHFCGSLSHTRILNLTHSNSFITAAGGERKGGGKERGLSGIMRTSVRVNMVSVLGE